MVASQQGIHTELQVCARCFWTMDRQLDIAEMKL